MHVLTQIAILGIFGNFTKVIEYKGKFYTRLDVLDILQHDVYSPRVNVQITILLNI